MSIITPKKRILKLSAAFISLAILILWLVSTQFNALPKGTRPNFPQNLVDIEGKTIPSIKVGSKPLLINFWATWCAPCLKETPGIVNLAVEFEKQMDFLGLAVESPLGEIYAFKRKFKIPYPLAVAPFQMVADWKAEQLPMTYILNKEGEIVWTHLGFVSESDLRAAIKDAL